MKQHIEDRMKMYNTKPNRLQYKIIESQWSSLEFMKSLMDPLESKNSEVNKSSKRD